MHLVHVKGVRIRLSRQLPILPIFKMKKSWDANALLRSFASIPSKIAATLFLRLEGTSVLE